MIETIYPYGNDFPILQIKTPLCEASVSLYGGQVLGFAPKGKLPILWLSPKAEFKTGKAIRGGIPICWPWFGKKENAPSHGYARTSLWNLEKAEVDEAGILNLILTLPAKSPETPNAKLTISLGKELILELTTTAGNQAIELSEALHSYFNVSDFKKVLIFGLENIPYEEFGGHAPSDSSKPLNIEGSIDRIYHPIPSEKLLVLTDSGWNRNITIERKESKSVVVWNPGDENAVGMGDVGAGNNKGFLCVEAANTPQEILHLAPGESHTLSCIIY